jgi:hypothetical protein
MSDLNHANQIYNNKFNQINTNKNAYINKNTRTVNDMYPSIQNDQKVPKDQALNGNFTSNDRNLKKSKRKEDVAHQDIIITPNGPIQIIRKDSDEEIRALSPRKFSELNGQYSKRNSYEYQHNIYSNNKPRRSKYKSHINPYDYHYQYHHYYDDDYNDKYYSKSKNVRHNQSKYLARKPFDWYKPKHSVLIDDFEEVLPLSDMYPLKKDYCSHPCYSYDYHKRSRKNYDNYPTYYEHHYDLDSHHLKMPHYSRRGHEKMQNLKISNSYDSSGHYNSHSKNDINYSYNNSVQLSAESFNNNTKSNYLKYLESSKSQTSQSQYNLDDVSLRRLDLGEPIKKDLFKY